jgi:hypothetical protein
MRFGLLGLIMGDRSDVTCERVAFARELGFRGLAKRSLAEHAKAMGIALH